MNFKVELLKNCKICGNPIPKGFRTYCSKNCRNKRNYQKFHQSSLEWARKNRGKFEEGKRKCLICGNWYVQVGSHVKQTHGETAREYKKEFDLPVKSGVIPDWYKELKGQQALENDTYLNLKAGKKFWFKKGDPKAKVVTGRKGREGNKKFDYVSFEENN